MLLLWLSESSVSRTGVGVELEALDMSGRRPLGARGVSGTRGRQSRDHVGGWRSRQEHCAERSLITRLEGEDDGVCVVRISGEGIEPIHHPGGLDRVGVGGRKNSLVAVTVVTAVGVSSAGHIVAVAITDTSNRGKDGDESGIDEARVWGLQAT